MYSYNILYAPGVSGYAAHSSAWNQASLMWVIEMNVLLVEAVVKGYHECPFTIRTGEAFSLEKKF